MVSLYTIENYIVLVCLAIQLVISFVLFFLGGFSPFNLFAFIFNIFVMGVTGVGPFSWFPWQWIIDKGKFAVTPIWRPIAIMVLGGQGFPAAFGSGLSPCYYITTVTGVICIIIGIQFFVTDLCVHFGCCCAQCELSTAPLQGDTSSGLGGNRAKVNKDQNQAQDVEAK